MSKLVSIQFVKDFYFYKNKAYFKISMGTICRAKDQGIHWVCGGIIIPSHYAILVDTTIDNESPILEALDENIKDSGYLSNILGDCIDKFNQKVIQGVLLLFMYKERLLCFNINASFFYLPDIDSHAIYFIKSVDESVIMNENRKLFIEMYGEVIPVKGMTSYIEQPSEKNARPRVIINLYDE